MTAGHAQPQQEPTLTIAQVAERTGLSPDTLRYYERAGLIQRIDRTTGNQRRYAAADLAWLEFLIRLRETGMSISDMQCYAQLRAAGDATTADRLTMLRDHRRDLAERIRDLQRNAVALDDKIKHYETLLDQQPETDTPV
ncbi:MerR family transcriptional regulator [Streptomyces sp. NPDC026672]|uniref:MerR family transcriptional regulator n=1 Tax=unclassified Streptomyces TaxID=2593676 RepID=UPI0033CB6682